MSLNHLRARLKIEARCGLNRRFERKNIRDGQVKQAQKTKRYPSDMSDIEWAAIRGLLPRAA
ncbi:transposase, partial [Paraburkholderia humisilvae]